MTTLAQYRTAVSAKIGLDNSTTGDQGAIDLWVNEGVVDVMIRTKCQVRSATSTFTAGSADYTLSTSILAIVDLETNSSGGVYPLIRRSVAEIKAMRRSSAGTFSSPVQYYALAGNDLLMVYPTPSQTDTITYIYIPRPATLAASSDSSSEIPTEWHKAIEYYALSEAGDYDDDASSQQGLLYRQKYEQFLLRIRREMAMKGGRLPRARLGPVFDPPPHDRSRYPGGSY